MILVDSSAWIEFRDTGSRVCARVDELLDGDIATCDPVRMEVLAGARDGRHLDQLRRLLARATVLPTEPSHYEYGAALYRARGREGEFVRRLVDCVIAAVAISEGVGVLASDADFDVLARHTPLHVE